MTILFGATLVLVGGTIAAASLPSSAVFWSQTHPVAVGPSKPSASPSSSSHPNTGPASAGLTATPSPPAQPVTTVPTPGKLATSPKSPAKKPITYTVKKGDTLSGIAQWFKQHGYKSLYAANRSVIGSDPDLIIPGERITISNGVMTLRAPK